MPKVQMSIKMESELRDEFLAVAQTIDRPAAQIVRELMRGFIEQKTQRDKTPNAITIAAMEAADRGEYEQVKDVKELAKALGI